MRRLALCLCAVLAAAGGGPARVRAADPPADLPAAPGVNPAAFVARHCAECHGPNDPEGSLSLAFPGDDATLRRDRKQWLNAVRRAVGGEMPPAGHDRPAPAEIEAFAAAVRGRLAEADRRAPPDPGRVTMRRLNRTEYRNTVRDLLGVDFDPTDDFPSDEIAHGFDTVGDALSLTPLLLDRYLDAADAVVQRAIPVPPLEPKKRWWKSRYSAANLHNRPDLLVDNFRKLTTASEDPLEVGPITSSLGGPWEPDGEYECVTRLYAGPDVPLPLEVTILASGSAVADPDPPERLASLAGKVPQPARVLHVAKISGTSAETKSEIRFKIAPRDCGHKIVVAVVQPPQDAAPVTIFVEGIGIDGPKDSRPDTQKRLLACAAGTPEEQSREVLGRFLRRAFRRPVEPAELERFVALVMSEMEAGRSWEAAMHWAFQAAVVSPKFLFRVEPDERQAATAPQPLDQFQLASRLSYFLWSSMPDDELLDRAAAGTLTADLPGQVRRMIADPKAAALVDGFAMQWLQLRRLEAVAPDGKLFPSFDGGLRKAMLEETRRFFAAIMGEDRSILELLDADHTFVNGSLARHYGIEEAYKAAAPKVPPEDKKLAKDVADGVDFRKVALPDRSRGGLVSQASILTATSNPTRTSPVKRGRWVLEQLLGEPPPPPPPDVPQLDEDEAATAAAPLRVRLEQHRRNPACAGCHARMDAIGFALEPFDAVGRVRTTDGPFPIDAAGAFPDGTRFEGPTGLKEVLMARRRDFARCLAENLFVYALGRGIEPADAPTIDRLLDRLEAQEYRASSLVAGIVESDAFRMRRAASAAE